VLGRSGRLDGWAREQGGRKIAAAHARERKRRRKTKGNVVNPASDRPIYRGVHRIYTLWFLSPYKTPQRLYPEKFARRLRRIFRETSHSYDLNLCLGR
jgi:hypothetical protein